jgi:predicted DNA-binding mobile mystery protein A
MNQASIARKNLDQRFAKLNKVDLTVPPRGWLKAVRESLCMTTRQVAQRMGVAPSRILAIEKAEINATTSLKTLQNAAQAMDCSLVYAIVPNHKLDDILLKQAQKIAQQEIQHIHHTMALENQSLSKLDLEHARQRLLEELLQQPRRLWDKV